MPAAFAVVHPTWGSKPDLHPGFPSTELLTRQFAQLDLAPDAEDWRH